MQTVIEGILTHYEDFHPKSKKTLLILHGWGSASSFWIPIAEHLTPDLRVVLLDLPSFGSTQPLTGEPDVPEYTLFVKNFIKKLGLKNLILAGHSFGGQITLDYSIKYPKNLRSIILIAPAVIRESTKIAKVKILLAKTIRPLFSILPNNGYEKFLGWYTPRDYSNSSIHQRKILKKIITYDLRHSLDQVVTPTDIIWGSEDVAIPYVGKLLAENLPDSRLHVVYGAGHLVFLRHQDQLISILNQIIKTRYV